jgi:hypothetical protein
MILHPLHFGEHNDLVAAGRHDDDERIIAKGRYRLAHVDDALQKALMSHFAICLRSDFRFDVCPA